MARCQSGGGDNHGRLPGSLRRRTTRHSGETDARAKPDSEGDNNPHGDCGPDTDTGTGLNRPAGQGYSDFFRPENLLKAVYIQN